MPIEITMPRLSDTMESGSIIKWNIKPGDEVSAGDVVADVETDKATMELAIYDDGVVASVLVGEGEQVDVGTVIAMLAEEGEDPATVASSGGASASSGSSASSESASGGGTAVMDPPKTTTSSPSSAGASSNGAPSSNGDSRMRVSPVARRLAEDNNIDLNQLQGSGTHGRIIKRDVLGAVDARDETAASVAPSARPSTVSPGDIIPAQAASIPVTMIESTSSYAAASEEGDSRGSNFGAGRVPLSQMRQTIARRLVESKLTVPHYQVSMSFDMEPIIALRADLNGKLATAGIKLSVNDFLVKACALAMHEHADFNASFAGDAIVYHGAVNIGVAISLPPEKGGGLVVATLRNADQKSLRVISAETKALAEKARTRGLSVEEMSDSTFTISNLGMFGVDHFTAIINPPNAAILAVGAAVAQPVVNAKGKVVAGTRMTATLSNDHRVIDGAMAAAFLKTLKESIESPSVLLV